ncbi:MAG: hypothetical protein HRU24_09260 [Gammaproteobacteria bacterium]|nr:hypothetical protein [Gammaproteobacteria bacterium]
MLTGDATINAQPESVKKVSPAHHAASCPQAGLETYLTITVENALAPPELMNQRTRE